MGLFFDIKTPADQKLLQDYDAAVAVFRDEVSAAMEEVAAREPSVAKLMRTAAEAVRSRPLPSEANSSDEALRRLTLSSLTVETAFSKLKAHAASPEAFAAAMEVTTQMREIGKKTISRPEFRPLTDAVLAKVAEVKPDVAREMDEKVFDLHVAALKNPPAAKKPAPKHPQP